MRSPGSVGVVLRSSGERTVDAALQLAAAAAAGAPTHVLREAPFEVALQAMCEAAASDESDWTLAIDADVLVSPVRLKAVLKSLGSAEPDVFQVQPYVLDKLTGRVRQAGLRIYRTRALAEAMRYIPSTGAELRPETAMVQAMEQQGWRTRMVHSVVALHDYEQYYSDVFRKAYVHSIKHAVWAGELVPLWRSLAGGDPDFQVALRGMSYGLASDDRLVLDIRTLPTELGELLSEFGYEEKPPLPYDAVSASEVENILESHPAVHEWVRGLPPVGVRARLMRQLRGTPWWWVPMWGVGHCLERFGAAIKGGPARFRL